MPSPNFDQTGDFRAFSPDVTGNWQQTIQSLANDTRIDQTLTHDGATGEPKAVTSRDALASLNARHVSQEDPSVAPRQSDYVVDRVIGEGAMGVVYQARQTSLARTVCVKTIQDSTADKAQTQSQFLREATLTGQLEHPNIVRVYDVGIDGPSVFYSMKRIEGIPWAENLTEKQEVDNLRILESVCNAVAFAHSRGVLHRDLKPENVMVGDFGEVLVVDWGLGITIEECARAAPAQHACCGTPAYLSPEMAQGKLAAIGRHTDIYLLGAVLYEICTGRPPHAGRNLMECLQHAAVNRVEPTSRDDELIQIAQRAMETDPTHRFTTVQDFQAALRVYANHQESRALAQAAQETLRQAKTAGDYELFSRALFGFEQASSLWPGNHLSAEGAREASLAYAQCAFERGDFDLAESLLPPDNSESRTLLERVQQQRQLALKKQTTIRRLQKAALEITLKLFRQFKPDTNSNEDIAPSLACPVTRITWYQCAEFCNWLNRQENIPEQEWCYQPNPAGKYNAGMKIAAGCLQRTGYRLPTEAEWEYAARSGATSNRFFAHSEALLDRYAWYTKNSGNKRLREVGRGLPNEFGLFDVLGNAMEWTTIAAKSFPKSPAVASDHDPGDQQVTNQTQRALRGGGYVQPGPDTRCTARWIFALSFKADNWGFRVARTLNK